MIVLWHLLLAFLVLGVVGYGGGPASIPLVEHEVVQNYGFMTTTEFAEVLAMANALPGSIATKMAGYIGFQVGGVIGALVAITATVLPSLIAMLILLGVLSKFKESPKVKMLTALVRPVIAVLLGYLTYQFFQTSYESAGLLQTVILVVSSYIFLEKLNTHPAWVILGTLIYGAIFLS